MSNKILIVEDDPSVSEMMKNYLQKKGYQVLTAFDGKEGIAKFSFALMILDIMMPKLSGIEIMKLVNINRYGGPPPCGEADE